MECILCNNITVTTTHTFGWTGKEVAVIGQGTWMIESGTGRSGNTKRHVIEALQLGIDLGMTHIDTAEMYGNGQAEELISEAISGRRDEVFLTSKVLPSNASYEGTLRACKQSLKRLKTDWLDLYLLHWPSNQFPIKETMKAMEKLVSEGLIRFIGVSNFDLDELKVAVDSLSNYRLACNQVLYHLGYRAIERRILPYCIEQEIAVVGYSPFGHGTFHSSSTSSMKTAGGRVLANIGKKYGRTQHQVALNFLTRNPNVFSIPKASQPTHVRENSGGTGWNLKDEDLAAIESIFPISDSDAHLESI